MSLNGTIAEQLRGLLGTAEAPDQARLNAALRLLAKWRSTLLVNTIIARHGTRVLAGPFAGTELGRHATEGAQAPRLLGIYEHELHATVEALVARGFARVVNVGCAEGYYAVGLARRLPQAEVFAFDINARAQQLCAELAAANGVAARLHVAGEFGPQELRRLCGADTLLVMDVEGAEADMLDPAALPWLAGTTLLVECHEAERPGVGAALEARFAASHGVTRIANALQAPPLPEWLMGLGHLDQLLACWEWRSSPTPWLLAKPRQG